MWSILSFLAETATTAAARRRAAAVLEALPDHYLADIGIDRCGIDVFVRETCPWPQLTVAHRPHHRPSLQGCG